MIQRVYLPDRASAGAARAVIHAGARPADQNVSERDRKST